VAAGHEGKSLDYGALEGRTRVGYEPGDEIAQRRAVRLAAQQTAKCSALAFWDEELIMSTASWMRYPETEFLFRAPVKRPEATLKPPDASRALPPTQGRSLLPPPIRPAPPCSASVQGTPYSQ
jgi:hypothetical protein